MQYASAICRTTAYARQIKFSDNPLRIHTHAHTHTHTHTLPPPLPQRFTWEHFGPTRQTFCRCLSSSNAIKTLPTPLVKRVDTSSFPSLNVFSFRILGTSRPQEGVYLPLLSPSWYPARACQLHPATCQTSPFRKFWADTPWDLTLTHFMLIFCRKLRFRDPLQNPVGAKTVPRIDKNPPFYGKMR